MNSFHYNLEPGEIAVLSASGIQRDTKGAYDNEIVLTNRNFVFVELGFFGGAKEAVVYPLEIISQAIAGIARNGTKQLQIDYGSEMDGFTFGYDTNRNIRLWSMAINDQMSDYGSYCDATYYDRFSEENLKKVSRRITQGNITEADVAFDFASLGNAAASILKSGGFSAKSLQRALRKGSPKKSGIGGGILKGLKDEFGITDIQNEFLDMFGMETEETNEEREDRLLDAAFDYEVYQARMEIASIRQQQETHRTQSHATAQAAARSVDEQIEAVKKLKELLDAGILTQDEFDRKKREVMNL